MKNISRFFVTIGQKVGRLDKAIVEGKKGNNSEQVKLTRSRVQQLIKSGQVLWKGRPVYDPNHKAYMGEVYEIILPPPEPAAPEPQALPLDIVYEDSDIIVVNKPAGMVVHPAVGNRDKTLVNALLAHCKGSLSGIGGVARPGIVHRLDKDTSGLMVVAKHDVAHEKLSRQFENRSLNRTYWAIIWGIPANISGHIEGAIGRRPRVRQKMAVVDRGGKYAKTYYKVIKNFGGLTSLIECHLATGRTHQIRVHMAHIGHPIVGDQVYGRQRKIRLNKGRSADGILSLLQNFPRQALHAVKIKFIHPCTEKHMAFNIPLPKDMAELLENLKLFSKKSVPV